MDQPFKVKTNHHSAAEQGEAPSARAITERLAKIRKTIKEGGSTTPIKAPSTPIKPSPAKRPNPVKDVSPNKRSKTTRVKKEDTDSDEVDNDVFDGLDTSNIIKDEPDIDESPSRRSARAAPKKVNYSQLAGIGSDDDDESEETADAGVTFGQVGGNGN